VPSPESAFVTSAAVRLVPACLRRAIPSGFRAQTPAFDKAWNTASARRAFGSLISCRLLLLGHRRLLPAVLPVAPYSTRVQPDRKALKGQVKMLALPPGEMTARYLYEQVQYSFLIALDLRHSTSCWGTRVPFTLLVDPNASAHPWESSGDLDAFPKLINDLVLKLP
jgi:hypothetical protein